MSYLIVRDYYNGYRCTCCYRKWAADPEIAQDFQSALNYIFPYKKISDDDSDDFDVQLKEIKIINCDVLPPNEALVAKATVEWPSPNARHPSRYKYTYLSGWIADTKTNFLLSSPFDNEKVCRFESDRIKFDIVYDGEIIDTRTRQEIDAEVTKEIAEIELQNAKIGLENTVKKLNGLGLNVHGFIDKK